MQITRQADYAVRAMYFLAQLKSGERASTRRIAEIQHIPPSFLAKIISQLSIAGLIHTSRGARGGVSLSRDGKEISLLNIVEAIDGPIVLNECTPGSMSDCPYKDECPILPFWCDLQKEMAEKLNQATLDQFRFASSTGQVFTK